MVFGALCAGSVVGVQSASTIVCVLDAKSAVGDHYASTIVGALCAGSVVGDQSAITVVNALFALYVTHMDTRYAHDEIDDTKPHGLKILQVHWKIFV